MKMTKWFILTLVFTLGFSSVSQAVVPSKIQQIDIEIISELGLKSSFDTTTDILSFFTNVNNVAGVKVTTNTDNITEIKSFTKCVTSVNFTLDLDMSHDGIAKGYFKNVGTWSTQILNNDLTEALYLEGGLVWYYDEEEVAQTLRGKGIITVNTANIRINSDVFNGAVWGSTTQGLSGIKTVETALSVSPLADYQSSYNANSATVTLFADHSVIPEPTAMLLLAAGAAAFIRRKKIS